MGKFIGYRCSLCGTEYAPNEITYTCPKDGGNLDVVLDYDAQGRLVGIDIDNASLKVELKKLTLSKLPASEKIIAA